MSSFTAHLFGNRALPSMLRSVGVQVLIVVMNMLTGIITARLLGAQGRGVYAAVTLWPPLLGMLATAGLSSAVIVRLRRDPASRSSVAGAAWLLGFLYSLPIIGIGVLLLPLFMTRYSPDIVFFAQACLVTVALNASQIVMRQTFAGTGQYWYCNLTHLLPQALHLAVLVTLMLVATVTPRAAALALFASSGLTVLVMLWPFLRSVQPRLRAALAEMRALSSYAMRAAPTGLVAALLLFSDRLVLIPMLPAAELGFYAVAFSFSRVIQFVQPALQSIFLSHMSSQDAARQRETHDHAVRFLLATLIIGCGLLALLGKWLLVFAYGPEFAAANSIFRLLFVEASLGVLSQVTVQLFLSRERPGLVSAIQTVMLAVSLGLLVALVPKYGAFGAAVALVTSGFVRWVVLLVALKRVLAIPPPRLYLTPSDLRLLAQRLRG